MTFTNFLHQLNDYPNIIKDCTFSRLKDYYITAYVSWIEIFVILKKRSFQLSRSNFEEL